MPRAKNGQQHCCQIAGNSATLLKSSGKNIFCRAKADSWKWYCYQICINIAGKKRKNIVSNFGNLLSIAWVEIKSVSKTPLLNLLLDFKIESEILTPNSGFLRKWRKSDLGTWQQWWLLYLRRRGPRWGRRWRSPRSSSSCSSAWDCQLTLLPMLINF